MARTSTDPAAAIPEADLQDQQTPAAPDSLSTTDVDAFALGVGELFTDEADVLEQLSPLPEDDAEDYPNADTWGWPGA